MNTRRVSHPMVLTITAVGIAVLLTLTAVSLPSLSSGVQADSSPALPSAPSFPTYGPSSLQADNPISPTSPVKLIFIHHSTGGNWLADIGEHDQAGGLGQALMDNNYFVSATNYQWGPRSDPGDPDSAIGSRTDIPNWPEWFTGTVMSAVYTESGQNIGGFGDWSRMADPNPGGENEVIMFKSCFPNSDLYGNPNDPPLSEPDDSYTVANAKAVYNRILEYFTTRQDKLFIVITAPPMAEGEYGVNDPGTPAADRAANARAFNNWLVYDWLATNNYTYINVAVFDYYNGLTSNGSPTRIDDTGIITEPNDFDMRPDGNHHYWNGSDIAHTQTISNNFSAYPSYSGGIDDYYDSHPMGAGQEKATAEFVPLLNVFYNRWKSGVGPVAPGLRITQPTTTTRWPVSSTHQIHWTTVGTVTHVDLAYVIDGVTTTIDTNVINTDAYLWTTPPTPTASARVRVASTVSPTLHDVSPAFTLYEPGDLSYTVFLPLILRSYGTSLPVGSLIQPGDLVYRGAFRLPGGDTPPLTFAYGGNAMTFNPDGDATNTDGYPGSLFVMGHDRQAWGGLPDGNQVAEIRIPVPVVSANLADLPQAEFIQTFHDVTAGYFAQLEEIPKAGMQYLDHPLTGPKIHLAWGQHLQPPDIPSQAWFDPNLATPDLQGAWFIADHDLYSVNGYMFDIPAAWANTHTGGQVLATGRFRDGGQGGMGPALFAYRPWLADGSPPISGTHLSEVTTLLLYENAYVTSTITRNMDGYQHADEWEGGAWMTTGSGKSAVLFAGTKSNGTKYWYGYINPLGPEFPCVDDHVTDFVTCRLADGSSCPAGDLIGCCSEEAEPCVTQRGWWSTHYDGQLILYDPADLAQVAAGTMQPWEPQPYGSLDIDPRLYLNPTGTDLDMLGFGDQRRYRIGAAAYDHTTALLYVLELFVTDGQPVVHVWQVQ